MTNYNYLLIEANQVKIGGYNYVSVDFVNSLVENIYAENPTGKKKIMSFIKSNYLLMKSGVYCPFNYSKVYLTNRVSYKANTKSSSFLRYVYQMSEVDEAYRELAFVMFALRLVDPIEYLAQEDVSYVLSSISCDAKSDCIVITIAHYIRLMLAFIQNVSNGVDYGVCPWDFVYHITRSVKNRNVNKVYKTIASELANGDRLEDYTALSLSQSILEKYTEEVIIMTPILCRVGYIDRNKLLLIMREIIKKKYKVEYMQFILNNNVVFDILNSDGLKWEFAN